MITMSDALRLIERRRDDDFEEVATRIDEVIGAKGPAMVAFKTEPEIQNTPIREQPRGATRRTPEAVPRPGPGPVAGHPGGSGH